MLLGYTLPTVEDSQELEPGTLSLDLEHRPDWAVVVVKGEVDISNAEQLHQAVTDLVDKGDKAVAVDMRTTTFMDSSGLRVLIRADDLVSETGGRLLVLVNGGPVDRLFHITGLESKLNIAPDFPN